MATGTFTTYSAAVLGISTGTIDLDSSPLYMALLTSAYTPADTHSTWADVSASQVATGGGYAGPVKLTNAKCTLAAAVVTFTSDPVAWSNATMTAHWAVMFVQAGASPAASDKLVGYVLLSTTGDVVGQGGQLSVGPDPINGWMQFSHSP